MSAAPRNHHPRSRHSSARRSSGSTSLSSLSAASPILSGNTATYASQLHTAILATREALITEHQGADAGRVAALGGLDVARRTFADARYGLKNTIAIRSVTSFLDQKIGDANETGLNTVALGENANTEALAAASSMNDAATSIKAAASAVETVIVDVNGVAGVTNANDRDDVINRAAHEAVTAVAKLGKAVDELKCLALLANVEAARPRTAPVAQAAQANQTALSNLLSTFDSALKAATSAVTDAQSARTADLNELFARSESFTVSASDDSALGSAITAMDAVSNDSLKAVVQNWGDPAQDTEAESPEDKKQGKTGKEKGRAASRLAAQIADQGTPGFKVSWSFSAEIAKETIEMTCFAVPLSDAPSFDFQTALAAQKAGYCANYFGPLEGGKLTILPPTGSVVVQIDSNGHKIALGSQYRIFALRTPDSDHGPQTATHFSFPTPPITSTILLSFSGPPKIYPPTESSAKRADLLPHNVFIAVFPAGAPSEYIDKHRLFFSPKEVLEAVSDELTLADALNAASFTELKATDAISKYPADLAKKLWSKIYSEVPSGGAPLPAIPPMFAEWLETTVNASSSSYVVYFSPFGVKDSKDKNFTVGQYTDMYGDLFDLEERAYEAFVLAVGKTDSDGDPTALNVLSEPSAAFPSNVSVAPLPTDAPIPSNKE